MTKVTNRLFGLARVMAVALMLPLLIGPVIAPLVQAPVLLGPCIEFMTCLVAQASGVHPYRKLTLYFSRVAVFRIKGTAFRASSPDSNPITVDCFLPTT